MIERHAASGALSLAFVLSLSSALIAAPVQPAPAQEAAPAQMPAQVTPAAPAPAPPGASERRGPAAEVEPRIADLHKRLHITAPEEPEFKAFADLMRANAQSMESLFQERAQHRDRTAPGMMHWYAQLATAHADAMNKLVPAFDALYQSLSDKQKKSADAVFQALRQARPPRRTG